MTQLDKDINEILKYLDENRWISFTKDDSARRFKAKDKLRAYGLIERHSKLSWQLTREGYHAIELGGFHKWMKTQKKESNLSSKTRSILSKFWWTLIIPLVVWFITEQYKEEDNTFKNQTITNKTIEDSTLKEKESKKESEIPKSTELNYNKIYIQSFKPIELYNGNLVVTLNNSVEAINGEIELKVVSPKNSLTEIFKNKKVGDLIEFNNYRIILSSLKKNIMTYDLIIKIEQKE